MWNLSFCIRLKFMKKASKRQKNSIYSDSAAAVRGTVRFMEFEFFVCFFFFRFSVQCVHTSYMMHGKRTPSASLTISHHRLELNELAEKKVCVQINKSNKYSLPRTPYLNRILFFHLDSFSFSPARAFWLFYIGIHLHIWMNICDSSGYESMSVCFLWIRQKYGPPQNSNVCELRNDLWRMSKIFLYKQPNGMASHIL